MNFSDGITAAIEAAFPTSIAYDTFLKRAGTFEQDMHLTLFFPEKESVEVWLPACDTLVERVRAVWKSCPPVQAMHRQHVDTLRRVTIALTEIGDE